MEALEVLQKLGNHHLVDDMHAALVDVAAEVARTGKPGSVTVTLKVSHPDHSDQAVVVVDEEVKKTPPKTDPRGAMFYAVNDGLHARDPRQPEFFTYREGPNGTSELRVAPAGVDAETGEIRETRGSDD